ncbi:MAG: hypothetical protein SF162_01660 [bacterium]|nr:hypothetical protein [bacterium]
MTLQRRIATFLNIQPGESRSLLWMMVLFFFLGSAYILTETAAFALFVNRFGADFLPYTYVVIGIGVSTLTFFYLRLVERFPSTRLVVFNLAVLFAATLAIRFGLELTGDNWMIFLLPVWKFVLVYIGSMSFWAIFGRLYDVREAKRLSGLAGSGRWFASVMVGFTVPLLVPVIGATNLLAAAAVNLLIAVFLARYILRRFSPTASSMSAPAKLVEDRPPRQSAFRYRYVVLIFVYTFCAIVAGYMITNVYFGQASEVFTSADDLAIFTSRITGFVGILILGIQLFITGRLLNRYGLWAGLLIQPLVTGAAVLLLMIGGFANSPVLVGAAGTGRRRGNIDTGFRRCAWRSGPAGGIAGGSRVDGSAGQRAVGWSD